MLFVRQTTCLSNHFHPSLCVVLKTLSLLFRTTGPIKHTHNYHHHHHHLLGSFLPLSGSSNVDTDYTGQLTISHHHPFLLYFISSSFLIFRSFQIASQSFRPFFFLSFRSLLVIVRADSLVQITSTFVQRFIIVIQHDSCSSKLKNRLCCLLPGCASTV